MILSNHIYERDLIPPKTIVMFSGTEAEIPVGWALCDGRIVNGYTTPDLTGKFILPSNTAHQTGGRDKVTLTVSNMPSHNHTFTGDEHTHQIKAHNHGMLHNHTTPDHVHSMNHSHTLDHTHVFDHTHTFTLSAVSNGAHHHTSIDKVGTQQPIIYYSESAVLGGVESKNTYGLYNYSSSGDVGGNTNGRSNGSFLHRGEQVTTDNGAHTHNVTGSITMFEGSTSDANNSVTSDSSTSKTGLANGGNTGNSIENTESYGPFNTEKTTQTGTIGKTGGGASFDIIPPYYTLCFIMRVM